MAPNSQVDQADKLVFQIRELYGRTTYTHKVHEKCADIYRQRLHTMKVAQIVLSALTTGSFLLAIFGDSRTGTIVGAGISTLLFGLNLYLKDYDLGELSQKHITVASRLWDIRESYLSLLTDLATSKITFDEARIIRDELQDRLSSIYYNAPRTVDKAYNLAQRALKIDEEMTFSSEEIDMLLPEALRIPKD